MTPSDRKTTTKTRRARALSLRNRQRLIDQAVRACASRYFAPPVVLRSWAMRIQSTPDCHDRIARMVRVEFARLAGA